MSKIIKNWTESSSSNKKVISIKLLNTSYQTQIEDSFEEEQKLDSNFIENAKLEAEDIIYKANQDKDAILRRIQEEKEKWNEEKAELMTVAQDEGFKIGFEDGLRKGYSEYQELLKNTESIIESAKEDYKTYLESSETTILELAINIAKKIIGSEIDNNNEKFLTLVKKAVKEVKEYQQIQIHVHPQHYQLLLGKKEELISIFPRETNLFIYPDDDLKEESCIIESEYGRIDASVDTQLLEIKRKLMDCLESGCS